MAIYYGLQQDHWLWILACNNSDPLAIDHGLQQDHHQKGDSFMKKGMKGIFIFVLESKLTSDKMQKSVL